MQITLILVLQIDINKQILKTTLQDVKKKTQQP